ncbi:MAG: DUF3575 domain-containing protein [Segetibacter sp.]
MSQTIEGKNMGKVNLSAFVFKGFNLQYERQVSPKVTVALSYGIIPLSTISFKSYIKNQVYNPDVNIGDYRLGTSIFTPEVRYYLGKKGAFHGFYLAPYIRIGSYKIEGPIAYFNSEGAKQNANFKGKFNNITGGLMIGSSWQLSERFYLDWWIAGASFGGERGNFTAATQLTPDDQVSLKRKLESISLLGITIKSEVNSNGAIVKTSGSMVGVRGLGINFGIRF